MHKKQRTQPITMSISVITLTALGLLQGCAVGPDYEAPETSVPDQWQQKVSDGQADLQHWWTLLNDPVLDTLIERSSAGNLTLQIAMARIDEARTQQLLLQYEQTVLSALEEVEGSMVAYLQEKERVAALRRSVTASRKSVELVNTLYKNGLVNFQNVLDMQRSLATSEGLVTQNLVRGYKALGGGWAPDKSTKEALSRMIRAYRTGFKRHRTNNNLARIGLLVDRGNTAPPSPGSLI